LTGSGGWEFLDPFEGRVVGSSFSRRDGRDGNQASNLNIQFPGSLADLKSLFSDAVALF